MKENEKARVSPVNKRKEGTLGLVVTTARWKEERECCVGNEERVSCVVIYSTRRLSYHQKIQGMASRIQNHRTYLQVYAPFLHFVVHTFLVNAFTNCLLASSHIAVTIYSATHFICIG